MTNDTQISVGPLVQVVLGDSGERVFPFSDMELSADPAVISDRDLLLAVARHLDRPDSELLGLMVTRPATGNVLISPKPVFGDAEYNTPDQPPPDEPIDWVDDVWRDIVKAETTFGDEAHTSSSVGYALIAIAKSLALIAESAVHLKEASERARIQSEALGKAWKDAHKRR